MQRGFCSNESSSLCREIATRCGLPAFSQIIERLTSYQLYDPFTFADAVLIRKAGCCCSQFNTVEVVQEQPPPAKPQEDDVISAEDTRSQQSSTVKKPPRLQDVFGACFGRIAYEYFNWRKVRRPSCKPPDNLFSHEGLAAPDAVCLQLQQSKARGCCRSRANLHTVHAVHAWAVSYLQQSP